MFRQILIMMFFSLMFSMFVLMAGCGSNTPTSSGGGGGGMNNPAGSVVGTGSITGTFSPVSLPLANVSANGVWSITWINSVGNFYTVAAPSTPTIASPLLTSLSCSIGGYMFYANAGLNNVTGLSLNIASKSVTFNNVSVNCTSFASPGILNGTLYYQ